MNRDGPSLCNEAQGQLDGSKHLKVKRGVVCRFWLIEPHDKPQGMVVDSREAEQMGVVKIGDNTPQPIKHIRDVSLSLLAKAES